MAPWPHYDACLDERSATRCQHFEEDRCDSCRRCERRPPAGRLDDPYLFERQGAATLPPVGSCSLSACTIIMGVIVGMEVSLSQELLHLASDPEEIVQNACHSSPRGCTDIDPVCLSMASKGRTTPSTFLVSRQKRAMLLRRFVYVSTTWLMSVDCVTEHPLRGSTGCWITDVELCLRSLRDCPSGDELLTRCQADSWIPESDRDPVRLSKTSCLSFRSGFSTSSLGTCESLCTVFNVGTITAW